jgi:hypothetical protein
MNQQTTESKSLACESVRLCSNHDHSRSIAMSLIHSRMLGFKQQRMHMLGSFSFQKMVTHYYRAEKQRSGLWWMKYMSSLEECNEQFMEFFSYNLLHNYCKIAR